jgi:ATP-dependent DNA helicase RecG
MKTLCAFANAAGGTLIIGQDDSGKVVGITNTAKLLEDLPNKIKNAMAIIADINAHKTGKNNYITITVGAYPFPISYHGVYYIRSGSTTQELTGNALDEFMFRKHGKTWDSVPVPSVKFADFESDAFKAFRRKAIASARLTAQDLEITDEMLLKNLRLIDGDYLKRAALLLFHQDPENWVTGAYLKVGLFENAADLLYQDEIHGPLITMADKAEELVYAKYFKGIISYEGLQRIENYPIPRQAFREAVLNAIIHRDYSTGNPIHIHIYPDKVLIYNDGRLPETWTVEDLFAPHTSKPHNPLIAGAFFRSGQIEAWGRGVEKIASACESWGKPKPFYRMRVNEVMIGFHTDESIVENLESIVENIVETPDSIVENIVETPDSIVETSDSIVENIVETPDSIVESIVETTGTNETQMQILELIRNNPQITAKQMAQAVGIAPRNVQVHIQTLKKLGIIERVGAAKGGQWLVK